MVVSFRMPEAWRDKVSDQQLGAWLREYALKHPALPADPGSGPFRRSFRLSQNDKLLVEQVAGGDVSSFLRRLITYRLGLRRTEPVHRVPILASPGSTRTRAAIKPDPIAGSRGTATENQPSPRRGALPLILSHPCPENGYSPMWRDGQWIREPRTAEEDRAYQEFLNAAWLKDQKRR